MLTRLDIAIRHLDVAYAVAPQLQNPRNTTHLMAGMSNLE